jgi:hypothetical protein
MKEKTGCDIALIFARVVDMMRGAGLYPPV